ncbi:MAG: glutathione S-transferase family protein [Hydrogenophaga sp.]|nr:glutathione S-transferase family protein [Hydrogenophaga sp.]MBW8320715.1 glutathione S-transferase family protein [Rhizobium sp.]
MSRTLYTLCGADSARPFSPHCWKTVMSLRHKGLDFAETPLPFTEIPKVENGVTKIVPLLRDGEQLVADSFAIALYLEETYPERPSLFRGEGGKAMARFVEGYSQMVLHTAISRIALLDIHDMLAPVDKAYFRTNREERFGKPLEQVAPDRAAEIAAFPAKLEPLRHMLKFQPFIGGERPLFCDYIPFGALQWLRITTGSIHLAEDDPARLWFERCLDLYDGEARAVA